MVGRIVRIDLREVWKHEAQDFSRWLSNNLDALSEEIEIKLTSAETEHNVGSFSVDLLAEDMGGNPVVIENQLERSDHDHLGKLLTYMVSVDSNIAIWIVSDPRPEHVGVISWLNESSSGSFFLVKLEAVRIGDSDPAPLFTLVVGPSEETRSVSRTKQDLAERHLIRHRFWTELLDEAKTKTNLHAGISPGYDNWVAAGGGKAGLAYNYAVLQHAWHVELGIDLGKGKEEETKAIFDKLHSHREEIEQIFGTSLEWDKVDGRRACRIRKSSTSGGYRDEELWPELRGEMIDMMIHLEKGISPLVAKL